MTGYSGPAGGGPVAMADVTGLAAALALLAPLASPTFTGVATAPSLAATGKTGATAQATILAGGTASGAPTIGTHVVGELVIDATGAAWFCTVAGTPGTWVAAAKMSVARQGGSATAWNAPGTTTRAIAGTPKIQVGAVVTGSVANGGFEQITVTFPTPFTQIPLVSTSQASPAGVGTWMIRVDSATITTCSITVSNIAGGGPGTCVVPWVAIGE